MVPASQRVASGLPELRALPARRRYPIRGDLSAVVASWSIRKVLVLDFCLRFQICRHPDVFARAVFLSVQRRANCQCELADSFGGSRRSVFVVARYTESPARDL